MERRGAFDYILLETTGLADPGNIAPLFWVDEGLGSSIYLDGIVTIVDAKNFIRQLEQPRAEEGVHEGEMAVAHLQISHADIVVVNKADLVSGAELEGVKERVRSINSLAKVQVTDHSRVPQLEGLVLDLHAYDDVKADELDFASKGHSHLDRAIGTVTVKVPVVDASGMERVDAWLRSVLWSSKLPGLDGFDGWEIHRAKGRMVLSDGRVKMLQGVREIFELIDGTSDTDSADEAGRIVFIGRNLRGKEDDFQHSFDSALSAR